MLCVVGCLAVLSALSIPFLTDFYYVGRLLFLLLFFGGFINPPITGIMINSVAESQRTSANSIANISYNLLGYMPGPFIYGTISSIFGSVVSMTLLIYTSVIAITCLIYGMYLKFEQEKTATEGFAVHKIIG